MVDIQNIQHISDERDVFADVVEKITENWNVQREVFYQQIGLNRHPAQKQEQHQQQYQKHERQDDNDDEFSRELELELFEEEP